jgi:hypothetical protein
LKLHSEVESQAAQIQAIEYSEPLHQKSRETPMHSSGHGVDRVSTPLVFEIGDD